MLFLRNRNDYIASGMIILDCIITKVIRNAVQQLWDCFYGCTFSTNINRNILLNDMPAMVDVLADGGCLIISGFYKEDIPLLESKASNLGLCLLTGKSKGDWQMLKFAK